VPAETGDLSLPTATVRAGRGESAKVEDVDPLVVGSSDEEGGGEGNGADGTGVGGEGRDELARLRIEEGDVASVRGNGKQTAVFAL